LLFPRDPRDPRPQLAVRRVAAAFRIRHLRFRHSSFAIWNRHVFDRGTGSPIVVIPGIQGRWEWMRPTLAALARDFRVVSYSLCGDLGSGMRMDDGIGFEAFLRQLDTVLDRAGLPAATVCGVSYGGVIAVQYAATRPERVRALVLASAPGPGWEPSARQARYADRPWFSLPAFCATAPRRLGREIYSALPDWRSRIGFTLGYTVNALAAPMLPHRMAARVKLRPSIDGHAACASFRAPTLVVTGEPDLDRVVPVDSTRDYARLIPGARYEMMDTTGHLGIVTQPDRFARIVRDFIHASHP
jgi:pimeloyl-ACP methyl ester carboxylesterase